MLPVPDAGREMGVEVKRRNTMEERSSRSLALALSYTPFLPSLPTSLSRLLDQAWLWEHEPRIRGHVLGGESASLGCRGSKTGPRCCVCRSTLYDWIVIHQRQLGAAVRVRLSDCGCIQTHQHIHKHIKGTSYRVKEAVVFTLFCVFIKQNESTIPLPYTFRYARAQGIH